MKCTYNSYRIAVLGCLAVLGACLPLISSAQTDVVVALQRSDDGVAWADISPGFQSISGGSQAWFRATVLPDGGSGAPAITNPVLVTVPASGGQVEVVLQSSVDLQTWFAAATGLVSISAREFFRLDGTAYSQVPAVSFDMGDPLDSLSNATPVHTVNLTAFIIQQTEVTKAQWDAVAAWAELNGYDISPADGSGKGPEYPVTNVSWFEAVKFANAKSEMEGLDPVYKLAGVVYRETLSSTIPAFDLSENGYRLPTEAEWECAARGGASGLRFPWGDNITHDDANYYSDGLPTYDLSPTTGFHPDWDDNGFPYTSVVGSFAANGYGLFDLIGNVREWGNDRYGQTYYSSVPDPVTDPTGPESGVPVIRGGSWSDTAADCRTARRLFDFPAESYNNLGFRLVRRN